MKDVKKGFYLTRQPPRPLTVPEIILRMKQKLTLSDTQVNQITPIIENEITQINSLMDRAREKTSSRDSIWTKIESLYKSTEDKLGEFLTSEQLAKMKSCPGFDERERLQSR